MNHLVLISHGLLCEYLKASTEMIMGPQENIHTVALLPEDGQQSFLEKFESVIENLEEFTVFCDLAGGTPCNVAAKLIMSGSTFDLYSGMNMPMVISFINGEIIGEKSDVLGDAREGIKRINDVLASEDDDEE